MRGEVSRLTTEAAQMLLERSAALLNSLDASSFHSRNVSASTRFWSSFPCIASISFFSFATSRSALAMSVSDLSRSPTSAWMAASFAAIASLQRSISGLISAAVSVFSFSLSAWVWASTSASFLAAFLFTSTWFVLASSTRSFSSSSACRAASARLSSFISILRRPNSSTLASTSFSRSASFCSVAAFSSCNPASSCFTTLIIRDTVENSSRICRS
mmetsp:Transcript_43835/g.78336  ORF Transcript_43835/g.78336 Transcript_43835/m.78336 type:complete len:216 (+) Transcript_43835:576-1223(+)